MIAQIEQRRTEVEALCRRFQVRRLEVFGSAAAGDFRGEASDLDFLVEFAPQAGPGYADRYFGLLESLEALFGRPVDLVVAGAIKNPYFRESVERTRAVLYAA
jgi:predicted nucleotidyltransferase